MAAAVLFVAPESYLESAGRHKDGYLFMGLAAVFGEFGARYFFAFPFAILGLITLRRTWTVKGSKADD